MKSLEGMARLPLNYLVNVVNFKINQYYRIIEEKNGFTTLLQTFHNYTIVVESEIIVKL